MSSNRRKSAYWSVSVCFGTDERAMILDRIHTLIPHKYVLIVTIMDGHLFIMADIYFKFSSELNKTQVMTHLAPIGLNYPKRSLKIVTKVELEAIRLKCLSTVEFGFFRDEQPEDLWDGPINTDRRLFELEQSDDPDDPENQPKVSIRKIASKYRRTDCPERTSQIKRIIDDDGDYADPEYHIRKQQRLEQLARDNPGDPIILVETNKYFS